MSKPRVWVLMAVYDHESSELIDVYSSYPAASQAKQKILRRTEKYRRAWRKWADSPDSVTDATYPESPPFANADGITIEEKTLK